MSDNVRAWVWELDLPPARKAVLLWLAGRATDNVVAFPGEREIRDRTGLGERMVRYHLHGLTADQLDRPDRNPGPLLLRIGRPIRAGRNTSNVYVLRVPWAEPAAVRRDLGELQHIPDTVSRRAVLPPSEWTAHLMDHLGQARAGGLAGISTGLCDLDTITLGLSPGLYLLAVATGTGKTAIAGQIALHVAEQHGPVVFVSMELTDVDLAVRLVSVITNIRKEKLVTGAL